MKHATDFIGWYNRRTHERLGIALSIRSTCISPIIRDRRGIVVGLTRASPLCSGMRPVCKGRAYAYDNQLKQCESEFRCRRFYQFWPFCQK